jgi:hypothetical protein
MPRYDILNITKDITPTYINNPDLSQAKIPNLLDRQNQDDGHY